MECECSLQPFFPLALVWIPGKAAEEKTLPDIEIK